jgi:hypothetical protein
MPSAFGRRRAPQIIEIAVFGRRKLGLAQMKLALEKEKTNSGAFMLCYSTAMNEGVAEEFVFM